MMTRIEFEAEVNARWPTADYGGDAVFRPQWTVPGIGAVAILIIGMSKGSIKHIQDDGWDQYLVA